MIFIANKKRIFEKFFKLIIFINIVLALYHYYLNQSFKLSYTSIIGNLIALVWISSTEASVRKLEFKNQEKELIITKKTIFGKERNFIIKYSKLDYKVKNFNNFWGFLFGKKRLTLLNSNIEIVKIRSNEEFNEIEIEKILKNLIETKTHVDLA